MSTDVQAKSKVTKVTITRSYPNDYEIATIRGIDKHKHTVWVYKTKKYPATELDCTGYMVHGNYVYVYEGNKLVALNKQTGKKLWTLKNVNFSSSIYTFDKSNNLYIVGYYGNTLYKISTKGKVKWHKHLDSTKCFWPYGIKISGSKIRVYFLNSEDKDADGSYYVWLKCSNGKIIKLVN